MGSDSRPPDRPEPYAPKKARLCGFAALRENKNEGG